MYGYSLLLIMIYFPASVLPIVSQTLWKVMIAFANQAKLSMNPNYFVSMTPGKKVY